MGNFLQNKNIRGLQNFAIIFPSCEAPYKLPHKKETLLQSFGELYKGASLCYLLRNDANLFVCPHLLDLFVGEHICIPFLTNVFIKKVVCTKVRQQCIWTGGVPMHYSNATAAALE